MPPPPRSTLFPYTRSSELPWYFLGLQEMLVYFDPWLAGVVLPGLIIVGLIAIPYIDKNEKGNGYYTIAERKVEIDRKSTRLNSSHTVISYAVFCLKKKINT